MALPDDEFEFFFDKPWSDGLPVVIPTEERIAHMLTGTRSDPDEAVGNVPPLDETATVRAVASHAVMAGCKPEYMPVVLAGLEAIIDDRFSMGGIQGTMHSVARNFSRPNSPSHQIPCWMSTLRRRQIGKLTSSAM